MFLGISFFTNAHTKVVSDGTIMCKIKGSTSGRTVQVVKTTWTKGEPKVEVEVINDDALGANIIVKLEVTYTGKNSQSITETKTVSSDPTFAKAQGSTTIPIYITTDYLGGPGSNAQMEATKVKAIKIEGNACE